MEKNDLEREFTLILLFNRTLDEILLLRKNRGPYKGFWNGVGGHLKKGEDPAFGAIREVFEETNVSIEYLDHLKKICTISYPTGIILHNFCAIIDKDKVKQKEDEQLDWFGVTKIQNNLFNSKLAGDGNLPWLISEAYDILSN